MSFSFKTTRLRLRWPLSRKKFARHNLDALSLRKPKLIEKIINKGTSEVLNDLENITSLNP